MAMRHMIRADSCVRLAAQTSMSVRFRRKVDNNHPSDRMSVGWGAHIMHVGEIGGRRTTTREDGRRQIVAYFVPGDLCDL
ncbi:MAG: hypothetical protein NVS1B6_11790 [Steroidobacteraceae bacterium]